MKKHLKTQACISAIIAVILMLIGIITTIIQVPLFGYKPNAFYFGAINFILLGIFVLLFHNSYKDKAE
ncbi:MAG: hypothetical protein V1733_09920 [bacterium]